MNFDDDRAGTGTAEWAEITVNISRGCANNCLYCYAAHNASRFKLRERSDWEREKLTKKADMKSYPAREGVVMFPSSHDITPFNLEAYIRVAKVILAKGNRLLVVSKPRTECIYALRAELGPWKEQILFRFTIGSMNEATCGFWEPGAPPPNERLSCLRSSFEEGYRTSVSIEPMLAGVGSAYDVVQTCREYVSDTIWIGKMNKVRARVPSSDLSTESAVAHVLTLQRDEEIMRLYNHLKNDPLIRWKDSIKEVVAKTTSILDGQHNNER